MSGRGGIDEAFSAIGESLMAYTAIDGEIVDEAMGVRMQIDEISIETPVELSLFVDEAGSVSIGCVPPLYDVAVTIQPVLHHLRFRAVTNSAEDGDG